MGLPPPLKHLCLFCTFTNVHMSHRGCHFSLRILVPSSPTAGCCCVLWSMGLSVWRGDAAWRIPTTTGHSKKAQRQWRLQLRQQSGSCAEPSLSDIYCFLLFHGILGMFASYMEICDIKWRPSCVFNLGRKDKIRINRVRTQRFVWFFFFVFDWGLFCKGVISVFTIIRHLQHARWKNVHEHFHSTGSPSGLLS